MPGVPASRPAHTTPAGQTSTEGEAEGRADVNLWGAPRGAGQWPGVRREQNWETRGRKDCTREERGVRTPPTGAPGARRASGRLSCGGRGGRGGADCRSGAGCWGLCRPREVTTAAANARENPDFVAAPRHSGLHGHGARSLQGAPRGNQTYTRPREYNRAERRRAARESVHGPPGATLCPPRRPHCSVSPI